MNRAPLLAHGALLLALAVPAAWPCGICIEDKVAATYDYELVRRALAKGQVVVFCELTGLVDQPAIGRAARRVRGLEPVTLRISAQPAALSFAIDPVRQSPRAAVAAMQRALPPGVRVALLKLVTARGFEEASAAR